jgi:hypothetical protein
MDNLGSFFALLQVAECLLERQPELHEHVLRATLQTV